MFPILFACVLGRASHSIFVWRLERGERIGVLDILAGSTSLTSAVVSQLKLRMLSIFGICLVAIWALSPIGGQVRLRQMSLGHSTTTNAASFTYMVQKKYLGRFDTTDRVSLYPALSAVFNAALLGPPETKASPRDAWGDVKTPKLEDYEASDSVDDGGWYNIKDHDAVYTSLVGIPFAGIEDGGAIDYTTHIEARYLHLHCPEVCMNIDPSSRHDRPSYENFTGPGAQIFTWDDTRARNRSNVGDLKPLSFTYNDRGATRTSRCSLTTTYIEVKVSCATSKTCLVANPRRSRLDHPPAAYNLLDTPTGGWQNWSYFAGWFVKAMDGHDSLPTAVQGYLLDPDYPALTPSVLRFGMKAEKVPSDLYATRLGQLMNIYWECMQATYAIPGGRNDKTAAMGDNLTDADRYGLAYTATSQGTKDTVEDVIVIHGVWSVALIIASTAMIIASLVPPVIRHYLTRGPDVMLNVSSLATRDNPFVALPVSGPPMDATDRARLVKIREFASATLSQRVMLGGLLSEHSIHWVFPVSSLFGGGVCMSELNSTLLPS